APACPAPIKRAVRQPHRQSVLARESEKLLRMRPDLPGFTADAGKTAFIGVRPRDRRMVTDLTGDVERAVQQASRPIDFPERPEYNSQPAHGYDPIVKDEPGGSIVIALVVGGCEVLFKVGARTDVIALEPGSYAKNVQRPASPWQSGRVAGITQESRRYVAHWRKVGANKAYQPHAIIGREPRGGVFDPRGKLASACKGGNRLWLTVPATMK